MDNKEQQFVLGMELSLKTDNQPFEMLKDLVLRWFLQTQAPLVLQNGSLPEWFHGFITRKQTEELLKDRSFGCFLIRLNERSFGYILSYRAKDRCRHFVISCQRNGHYIISGDTLAHQSLAELISYYQTSKIEPFGENLTSACSKEEKSIYDEISLDQQQRASKQAAATPLLTRQESGSSSTTRLAKENSSHQPVEPRKKLQEQKKSLSKEKQNLSLEDPDAAPPIPDRNNLLIAKSLEEDFGSEANVYSAVKKHHLNNRSLEMPKDTCGVFMENPQKSEELGQAYASSYRKKINTMFALAKQSDRLYSKKVTENPHPETIYSEIGLDQGKSCFSEPQIGQSSLTPPKKATLSSPTSTSPKLSPKLPNKPTTSTELQALQPPFAMHATSFVLNNEHREPNHPKILPDSPRETMYGQINRMKFHKSTVPVCDDDANDTYEQIPFRWSKGITHDHDSGKLPKSSPIKPQETYDQISTKTGRSSKMQVYTKNLYKKPPDNFSKGLTSIRNVSTLKNTYEQVPFAPGKETEGKPNQKSDKPRRFLFPDKKSKS